MAEHLVSILGDTLYTKPINEKEKHLPSPWALRNKILIKAKRMSANSINDVDLDDDDDEEMNDDDIAKQQEDKDDTDGLGMSKKKAKKVSQKLSDLVNYIHAVHFPGFDYPGAKFFHMSSFGESKTKKILSEPQAARDFVKYNTRQLSRIYPGKKRQDSSNMKIVEPWCAGSQIGNTSSTIYS
jgi:hypothetical protein